jgi:hypothetical protein
MVRFLIAGLGNYPYPNTRHRLDSFSIFQKYDLLEKSLLFLVLARLS